MLESRPYQDEALQAIEKEWSNGIQRTAVVLPTGMGKTVVFARLIKDLSHLGRALVLVHRDELARSAMQKIHSVAPELKIGMVKAERNDVDADVIIGSVQTLARKARREQIHNVAMIIVDEAHHAAARTYVEILEHFGSFGLVEGEPSEGDFQYTGWTPTVGFSATLARDDHRGLGKIWQSVAYQKSILYGIGKGYLADVKAKQIVLDDLDLGDVKVSRGDYQEDDLGRALLGINAGPKIAEAWLDHAGKRQGFLFTPNVATAHQFASDFERAGIPNAVITGATPVERRLEHYSDFQLGKIQALVNCMVLTEGFDMPQAEVACIARATRSRNLYVQMAGRVLRPWPGKRDALLLDVVGVTAEQRLASVVDLSEGQVKEVKPGETITDAVDREGRESDAPVTDLGGRLRAKDVDLFGTSAQSWLRTRKGVWFIPARDRTYFLWPEPDVSAGFRVMLHDSISHKFHLIESRMDLNYARAWAEEQAFQHDPMVSSRGASWRKRKQPPSDAQLNWAKRLHVKVTEDTTKSELSDLLSIEMASRLLDSKVTW
jgi:superfamily II DNA or RNA helicase